MVIYSNFTFKFSYNNDKMNENELREKIHQAALDYFQQNKLYTEVNGVRVENIGYNIGDWIIPKE